MIAAFRRGRSLRAQAIRRRITTLRRFLHRWLDAVHALHQDRRCSAMAALHMARVKRLVVAAWREEAAVDCRKVDMALRMGPAVGPGVGGLGLRVRALGW